MRTWEEGGQPKALSSGSPAPSLPGLWSAGHMVFTASQLRLTLWFTRIPKDLWGRAQGCVSRDVDPWCPQGPAGLLQPWRWSPRQGLSLRKGGAKTSVPSEAQPPGERGGTKDAYERGHGVHLRGPKSPHFPRPCWQRKWMEDPSVKGHQSLGSNPPSAYQCYRVY